MLIFSIVYFLIQSKIIQDNYIFTRNSWLIFLFIALPWRLFTIHLIPIHTWYINLTQVLVLLSANIVMAIFTIVSTKLKFSIQWLYKAGYIFIFSIMIILLIIDSSIIQLGWNLFIKSILLSESWLSYTIAVSIIIIATPTILRFDKHFSIFTMTIIFYLLLLFLIVGLSGYEKDDHSAIRMVVHIVPIIIFSLFLGISSLLSNDIIASNNYNLKK